MRLQRDSEVNKMLDYSLNNNKTGLIIITFSVILVLLFSYSTLSLMEAADIRCEKICGHDIESDCPHKNSIPLQSYLGFTISFILAGFGFLILFSNEGYREKNKNNRENIKKQLKNLKSEEKKVFNIIENAGGGIFQSELIGKSGFSKVKISRILDKLENKNLIERKRRGMTNFVLIK